MLVFVINRLLQAIGVLLVMSVIVFVGIYLVGDPTSMMVSPEATELQRQAMREALSLDRSLIAQYHVVHGQRAAARFRPQLPHRPARAPAHLPAHAHHLRTGDRGHGALTIGATVGMIAAYVGVVPVALLMRIVDIQLSF